MITFVESKFPFRTPGTAHFYPVGEVNNLPSMTEPSMSMSIAEIMYRHSQSRPVPYRKNMTYTGDVLVPNVQAMSEMEQIDMQKNYEEQVNQLRDKVEEWDKKREARRKAREENARLKAAELGLPDKKEKQVDAEQERATKIVKVAGKEAG